MAEEHTLRTIKKGETLGRCEVFLYFCHRIRKNEQAPVVQWIEWRFPVPQIRVRFPTGVQS